MMNIKVHIFSIILAIGFFLLPNLNFACASKITRDCCNKEIAIKSDKKDCCSSKNSKNKNNSCDGKCGHSNCTTSSVSLNIILLNEIEFKNNNLDFSVERKNFYHSETFISSGFTSIWLIPKIS